MPRKGAANNKSVKGLWTPDLLHGPQRVLWWDTAALDTISGNSGGVTAWRDRLSGVVMTNQSTLGSPNQPQFGASMEAGRPVLSFPICAFLQSSTVGFNANGVTVFVVCRTGLSGANFERATSYFGTGNPGDYSNGSLIPVCLYGGGSAVISYQQPTGIFNAIVPSAFPLSVCAMRYDASANTELHVNGVSSGSANIGPYALTSTGVLLVGGDSGSYTDTWNGTIGEVIWVNRALAASEIQKVEGYLAAKWKCRLAASHPYANRPPTIFG